MSNNRANLLNKIRALMAKTVEAGCTEAEAMAALAMAQAMMDAYEVTEEDLKLEGEKASVARSDMKDPHNIRRAMASAIAVFTDCKAWTSNEKKTINFAGLNSDTEFAIWLLETLASFVQKELAWHLMGSQITKDNKRWAINGFVMGATGRISKRLYELHEAGRKTINSNALVVTKQELIVAKMNELGIVTRQPRNRGSRVDDKSYQAGRNAGDRASFGRPVDGKAGTLRLR